MADELTYFIRPEAGTVTFLNWPNCNGNGRPDTMVIEIKMLQYYYRLNYSVQWNEPRGVKNAALKVARDECIDRGLLAEA